MFVYLFKRFCVHYQTSKFGVQIMYKIIHKPIASVKYVNWFHGNPYFHSLSFQIRVYIPRHSTVRYCCIQTFCYSTFFIIHKICLYANCKSFKVKIELQIVQKICFSYIGITIRTLSDFPKIKYIKAKCRLLYTFL